MADHEIDNNHPKETSSYEVFRIDESGIADSWTWVGVLDILNNGRYTFWLEQVLFDLESVEKTASYSLEDFSTGPELLNFIQSVWTEEHLDWMDRDQLLEVIQSLGEIDENLAISLAGAVRNEFDDPVEIWSPVEEWAEKATWERRNIRGGGGAQWAAISESRKTRAAILFYIKRYKGTHHKMPKGLHKIRVIFGSVDEGADCSLPMMAAGEGIFECHVTFPDE